MVPIRAAMRVPVNMCSYEGSYNGSFKGSFKDSIKALGFKVLGARAL